MYTLDSIIIPKHGTIQYYTQGIYVLAYFICLLILPGS